MNKIDPELIEAASNLKKVFISLGMNDKASVVDNIVIRAMKNIEAEEEIGTETVEKTDQAVRAIMERLTDVIAQNRICNSDILAMLEDSQDDIRVIRENCDLNPDFISIPAKMVLSVIERVKGRIAKGGHADHLGTDSYYIIHRMIKGASRYYDEE